jgi:hypothetical protein
VYHYVIVTGISMLCLSFSYAQSSSTLMGARAGGLAYASSCLTDEWAIFNNVSGLVKVDKTSSAFTYDTQPGFKPFDRMAAAFAVPLKFGTAGAGVFRFGDQLYNEHIIALGFANTFGLASLGLKVNYIQYKAEGFGSKGVISLSFGGITTLTEKISIGAYIINLNQPNISLENEKLPTLLILGAGFQLTPETFVTTELEKDLNYPVKWKTGVEYLLYKKFTIRTGFTLNPAVAFFGLGFKTRKFKLDYAYQHDFSIGSRHQATVGYIFNKQK